MTTRDRILTAASELFAEHGPETNVNAVAVRARVNAATVYRIFTTKNNLYRESVLTTIVQSNYQGAVVERVERAPRAARLEVFIDASTKYFEENRRMVRLLLFTGLCVPKLLQRLNGPNPAYSLFDDPAVAEAASCAVVGRQISNELMGRGIRKITVGVFRR